MNIPNSFDFQSKSENKRLQLMEKIKHKKVKAINFPFRIYNQVFLQQQFFWKFEQQIKNANQSKMK